MSSRTAKPSKTRLQAQEEPWALIIHRELRSRLGKVTSHHISHKLPLIWGHAGVGRPWPGLEGCWKHDDSTVPFPPRGIFPLWVFFFPVGFFPCGFFPRGFFPPGTFRCSWLVYRRKLIRIICPRHGPMALVPLPEQLPHLQRRARPPKSPPAPSLAGVGATLGPRGRWHREREEDEELPAGIMKGQSLGLC